MHPGILFTLVSASHERRQREAAAEAAAAFDAATGEETLPTMTLTPGTTVDEAERRLILLTLEHTRNNKTRAAEILGISLKTLHNKLNRMKNEGGGE